MRKRNLFFLIILAIMFIPIVKAESDYYKYMWQYNASDKVFVTNDVIETDDGNFITVGFAEGYDQNDGIAYGHSRAVIKKLDSKGNLISSQIVDDFGGKLKRVFKSGDYYYAIGSSTNNSSSSKHIAVVKFTDDLEVKDTQEIAVSNDYDYNVEIYVIESDNYYYALSPEYASSYVVQISKDFSSSGEIAYSSLSSSVKSTVDAYIESYELNSVFVKEYQDGYLYYIYSSDDSCWYLLYYEDGKEVWRKEFSDIFFRDAVEINGNIYLIAQENVSSSEYGKSYIKVLDSKGEELSSDLLLNYMTGTYNYFSPEHIIVSSKGFFVTGTYSAGAFTPTPIDTMGDGTDPSLKDDPSLKTDPSLKDNPSTDSATGPEWGSDNFVLYFSNVYNIEVKTDGHGTVTSSATTAYNGDEITFTVTPNKGYVLKVVKVTDSNGNTVEFTSNTFTMPSADVVIEASFTVKNPDTKDVAIICAIVLCVVGIVLFIRYKKKLNYLK